MLSQVALIGQELAVAGMQTPLKRGEAPASGAAKALPMPVPEAGERPTLYADRVGEWYVRQKSDAHRKAHGLYLTPVAVADFMAGRVRVLAERMRILDPAAGAGILACAAIEALASRPDGPRAVELVAHEIDFGLIAPLHAVLDHLGQWCRGAGVELEIRVEASDFILRNAEALRPLDGFMRHQDAERDFDAVISNPPYFKIGKSDPRATAAACVVHGQPNIYGIFMAVGAAVLKPGGDFVFIVPRSFASGPYFRRLRSVFFGMIRPTEVHVFGSRRDAFSRDEVLQENVVVSGLREDHWHMQTPQPDLTVSASRGVADIAAADRRALPMPKALDLSTADKGLLLPLTDEDDMALELIGEWGGNLHSLGLDISTGSVVPFRAIGLVDDDGEVPGSHSPLLWMNHVKPMEVTWPLEGHKPEYIKRAGARALLVANGNYVLLRRFSSKEESRRLTAAPYLAARFKTVKVGFENHLNYIHRPGGDLTEDEAWGLSALLSSRLLDTCFRVISGNTQVSATEIRTMPLPRLEVIVDLGRRVKNLPNPLERLDDLVERLRFSPGATEVAAC